MHDHSFVVSPKHGYIFCTICGTYKSMGLKPREVLYENNYWSAENNRSTMQEQVHNLTDTSINGVSKIQKILALIKPESSVLEIGCAPGILMRELANQKCRVWGMEPDAKNVTAIREISGKKPTIMIGYYPDSLPVWKQMYFDVIVAMDVVEHVVDYKTFIERAHYDLRDEGQFIFMSPIIYPDGQYREKDFVAEEHAWIFSQQYLQEYLSSFFKEVIFDRWIVGHELVICKK